MKTQIMNKLITAIIILVIATMVNAQEVENNFQTRFSASAIFEPVHNLKFEFTPELRFNENFILDKSVVETALEYELLKFLSFGASYRFTANKRETKETEYLHRYTLNTTVKKKINRFTPSLRILYANYSDEDDYKEILRFKGKVKYNIPKNKLTPFFAVEAFQSLNINDLYKMRYSIGFDYKIFKRSSISIDYMLDYYLNEYRNKHIFSLGYHIKF
ncbi:MAG: DUF2490 domain-containing protein [Chloroflexia bacterium]|nr:DUF2490 domain-containing protein [Chloroflexia bacterium]